MRIGETSENIDVAGRGFQSGLLAGWEVAGVAVAGTRRL